MEESFCADIQERMFPFNVLETLDIQNNSEVFIYFILQSVLHEPKRSMGEPECD